MCTLFSAIMFIRGTNNVVIQVADVRLHFDVQIQVERPRVNKLAVLGTGILLLKCPSNSWPSIKWKHSKYAELERTDTVVPIAVETLGSINSECLALFITELGRQLTHISGGTRETSFFFQSFCHSATLQRCGFPGHLDGSTRCQV